MIKRSNAFALLLFMLKNICILQKMFVLKILSC